MLLYFNKFILINIEKFFRFFCIYDMINFMKSILYIINSHFWKSITGPFFAFIFPLIFIAILGFMLGYEQILGGILTIPTTTIALTILPTALFEFKSSSLLKRIGVTSIKPWVFMCSISLYYVLIMILGSLFTFTMGIIIFSSYWNQGRLIMSNYPIPDVGLVDIYALSFRSVLQKVNWIGFIWGNIMNLLISVSLGLLVSSLCKSSLSIQGVGIPILIISEFLAAQVLPISMVKELDGLYYASYLTPFKYSVGQIVESWTGNVEMPKEVVDSTMTLINNGTQNIFDVNQNFYAFNNTLQRIQIFNNVDKILNLIMPFLFTAICTTIALKRFRWSNR